MATDANKGIFAAAPLAGKGAFGGTPDAPGKGAAGGAVPTLEPGEGAGAPAKPKRKPASKGTGFDRYSGRRPMKEFPLTKGELNEIGGRSLLSTLGFSAASAAFTIWLGITQGLAFSGPLKPEVIAYWEAWKTASGWASIALFVFGAGMLIWNGLRVREIINETTHNE